MIQFNNVMKSYGGEVLLDSVSFKINKGEKCGLVGNNGSGKTTLLRLIVGEEITDEGTVQLPKNYTFGYLSQHLHFSAKTILEEAILGLRPQQRECQYIVKSILFGLGFQESDMQRPPSEFSGGYQLRLHLAKILAAEPDCLLLDEPTNYLDIVSIRWLTRFLERWTRELIIISHDREFMDSITSCTLGLWRKDVRKVDGGTDQLFAQIVLEEEIHERTRQNLEKKRGKAEEYVSRFGAKASKAAQAQSRLKMIAKIPALEKLAHINHLDFNFSYASFPGKVMLDVNDISFNYENMPNIPPGKSLVDNFSLRIEKGERIAIIGKNGRGKSTLLNLLAGELKPQRGSLKHSDNTVIGYFGQMNIDRLHKNHTLEEEIGNACPGLTTGRVRDICGLMMFGGDKAKKSIAVLSGGERSRVLLGKIIAKPCNLLLLDEPTNHLDIESIEAFIDALEVFEGAVIIVTHSELMLNRLQPTRLIVCSQWHKEVFLGNYDDFLRKGGWEAEETSVTATKNTEKKENPKKHSDVDKAKVLRQLQQKITILENTLSQLAEADADYHDKLTKASAAGNIALVTELSLDWADHKKKSDELFLQLEALVYEYEAKKTENEH